MMEGAELQHVLLSSSVLYTLHVQLRQSAWLAKPNNPKLDSCHIVCNTK